MSLVAEISDDRRTVVVVSDEPFPESWTAITIIPTSRARQVRMTIAMAAASLLVLGVTVCVAAFAGDVPWVFGAVGIAAFLLAVATVLGLPGD